MAKGKIIADTKSLKYPYFDEERMRKNPLSKFWENWILFSSRMIFSTLGNTYKWLNYRWHKILKISLFRWEENEKRLDLEILRKLNSLLIENDILDSSKYLQMRKLYFESFFSLCKFKLNCTKRFFSFFKYCEFT